MANARAATNPRPAWHIDAKWICSLLLLGLLAVTLPLVVAYRITQPAAAKSIISYTLVGLTSPDGIDSPNGLGDIKAKAAATGSTTLTISGIPVTITAADAATLSPRQLRLKVFGAFADKFYNLGAKGLAAANGSSAAAAAKFQNDSALISVFTASAHQQVTRLMLILLGLCLLLAALVVYFSYHLGRLVSLGLVLLLAGLPGILFAATFIHTGSAPSGSARPASADSQLAAVGGFFSYVAPLIGGYLTSTYMAALLSGLALMAVALVAKAILALKRR